MVAIVNLARLKHQLVAFLLHRTRARRRNIVSVLDLEDAARHVTVLLVCSYALRAICPIEHTVGNIHLHLSCVSCRLLLLLCLKRSCRTILHLNVCELLLLLSISACLMLQLLSLCHIRKLEVAIRDCIWRQVRRRTFGSYVYLVCLLLGLIMLRCMTRAVDRYAPCYTRLLLKHIKLFYSRSFFSLSLRSF